MGKDTNGGSKTPGPILVPVDFSGHAGAALSWACEQARLSGAQVIVLHVVHDHFSQPGYYKQDEKDLLKPMKAVAEKMMRRFVKTTGKASGKKKYFCKLETKLVTGLPVTRILQVADKVGAAHIVMGSQGNTGLKRILLGSTAEKVLRMSHIPVTIIKLPPAK